MPARILHVDLDAFFVEVCHQYYPELRAVELTAAIDKVREKFGFSAVTSATIAELRRRSKDK